MKRFWDDARAVAEGTEWNVQLDGRPVRLPGGAALLVPGAALADAIAAEWRKAGDGAKGGEMNWDQVPLTRLAGTAQERILPDPAPVAAGIARYGESDLLCYRAPHPQPLIVRQARAWQPLLDWAAHEYGARLRVAEGVMHLEQDQEALEALRQVVKRHDAWELAALGLAVPALGSLVLGLALLAGRLEAKEAHALATLDDEWQREHWGDDQVDASRLMRLGADVALAARFSALHRAVA